MTRDPVVERLRLGEQLVREYLAGADVPQIARNHRLLADQARRILVEAGVSFRRSGRRTSRYSHYRQRATA